jgi:hypothetical protein
MFVDGCKTVALVAPMLMLQNNPICVVSTSSDEISKAAPNGGSERAEKTWADDAT